MYATIQHFSWVPVNASNVGQSCRDVQCRIDVQDDVVGRIPTEWLIVTFHMMSVIAHFCNYYGWHATYHRWLRLKTNPGRWLEYFFSASIMQAVLQVMTGYTDVWILSMAAVLIAITQVFGHATEQIMRYNSESSLKWQFFSAGFVSFLPPWVAIYYSFYWAIDNSDPGPPDWVRALIWSLVVTFASFAGVMVYYIMNHRSDPLVSYKSERYYCILSLLSKTLLTWQLYFGIFTRADRDLVAYKPG